MPEEVDALAGSTSGTVAVLVWRHTDDQYRTDDAPRTSRWRSPGSTRTGTRSATSGSTRATATPTPPGSSRGPPLPVGRAGRGHHGPSGARGARAGTPGPGHRDRARARGQPPAAGGLPAGAGARPVTGSLHRTVTLRDGVTIPQIGLGVFQVPSEEAQPVVEQALELGYRHIDTAAAYVNEKGVGAAVRASGLPREDVFVTSKLRNGDQGFDSTLRAYDDTLGRLGLDALDLYLIHWPNPSAGLWQDSWRALERLRDEGRVRAVGVSNFLVGHLEGAARVRRPDARGEPDRAAPDLPAGRRGRRVPRARHRRRGVLPARPGRRRRRRPGAVDRARARRLTRPGGAALAPGEGPRGDPQDGVARAHACQRRPRECRADPAARRSTRWRAGTASAATHGRSRSARSAEPDPEPARPRSAHGPRHDSVRWRVRPGRPWAPRRPGRPAPEPRTASRDAPQPVDLRLPAAHLRPVRGVHDLPHRRELLVLARGVERLQLRSSSGWRTTRPSSRTPRSGPRCGSRWSSCSSWRRCGSSAPSSWPSC